MDVFLVVVLAVMLVSHTTRAQLQAGVSCLLGDGTAGVCSNVSSCASASSAMTSVPWTDLCCVEGEAPIICCRDHTPLQPRGPPIPARNSIAEQKCDVYAKLVFWEELSPILMLDPGVYNMSTCAMVAQTLIVGGERAEPMEFPHMAALGFGEEDNIKWMCGGTLISERFVLTVAHCLHSTSRGDVKWVRLGDLNLALTNDRTDPVTIPVAKRIPHQGYHPPALYNDIALLKLAHDVTFTRYIRPACLYTIPGDPPQTTATASGWGSNSSRSRQGSDDLMKVKLTLRPTEDCNRTFQNEILTGPSLLRGVEAESMICAGERHGFKDTCRGDSGGPLQIQLQSPYCMYGIIGLTSFGKSACGSGDSPGVYTRVSNYLSWIENHVWPEICQTQ